MSKGKKPKLCDCNHNKSSHSYLGLNNCKICQCPTFKLKTQTQINNEKGGAT